ncbi:hypothetical protein FKM82_009424 [Ascaphus truei]
MSLFTVPPYAAYLFVPRTAPLVSLPRWSDCPPLSAITSYSFVAYSRSIPLSLCPFLSPPNHISCTATFRSFLPVASHLPLPAQSTLLSPSLPTTCFLPHSLS